MICANASNDKRESKHRSRYQGTMPHTAAIKPERSFFSALAVQMRVIGALIMRELHTRYGRENIGYLWLIAEPLMLGAVITLLHSGGASRDGANPAVFSMVGYTIFIMFRGTVNRADGAIEANSPLLYHRMVTVLDICFSRTILELAGTVMAFLILYSFCYSTGLVDFPARPLWLLAGIGYVFWVSTAVAMIIMGGTYESSLLGRLVHPFSYFQIPLSAAFFEVKSVPNPFRDGLLYSPLPHSFEIVRYGVFPNSSLEYVDFTYLTAFCLVLTFLGLVAMKSLKRRIHLH